MKKLLFLMVSLLVSSFLWGITPEEIIRKMEANQVSATSYSEGQLIVTDQFGTRTTNFNSWAKGEKMSLIEFTSSDAKGQKILRLSGEIYLYYPDAEEVIRIKGTGLGQSVLGSDVSYEDMTGGKGVLSDYTVELLGQEKAEGVDCYRLKLTGNRKDLAYPVEEIWVQSDVFVLRAAKYYATSGRLLKTISVPETMVVSGKTIPKRFIISDTLKKSSSTEFALIKNQINIPIADSFFSLEELSW